MPINHHILKTNKKIKHPAFFVTNWISNSWCEKVLLYGLSGNKCREKDYYHFGNTSLVTPTVKNLPAMQETWVQSLDQEDPLEMGMATHSSVLAWKIGWADEPGGLQSMGSQRVGHWVTNTFTFNEIMYLDNDHQWIQNPMESWLETLECISPKEKCLDIKCLWSEATEKHNRGTQQYLGGILARENVINRIVRKTAISSIYKLQEDEKIKREISF